MLLIIFSDNAQRWLVQLNPKLHRGVRKAGNNGARFGSSLSHDKESIHETYMSLNVSKNFCRRKYNRCRKLHDSYRFPGINNRYLAATAIARNHFMPNDFSHNTKAEKVDEYLAHEMEIFKTFQDKVNIHEVQKWLAEANKRK